jgi:periplasmic protein TonB
VRRDLVIYAAAFAASLIGHVAVFEGLGNAARQAPKKRERALEFAVFTPPPPAAPPPEPPKPKPVDLSKSKPKRLVETPPPPNREAPPPEPAAEPPPPVFGVTMSSTVGPGSGSFSVRVGNTLMKEPEKEFTKPADVRPSKAVPLYQVSKMPSRRGQCEAEYPSEAKSMRVEGGVVLELDVMEDGRVDNVTVIKALGHGLDEAAVAALQRCRFAPAEMGGKAVATRIQYTYRFVLEE